MGTASLLVFTAFAMFFVAGARLAHLLTVTLATLPFAALTVLTSPYRRARVFAFVDPWKDPLNTGFHIVQSLLALGSGGLFGVGLGASRAKFFYLPEQYTDFIFSVLGEELAAVVYPAVNSTEAAKRLMNTKFAQPAIFAIEYSLAKLWMSWGIQPSALIGHSVGEFVAAVMAGVMSLEDALPLVCLRGRLMQDLYRGSMLSVRLPERELRPLLAADVSIAAVNGPSLTVASGPDAAIQALEKALQERGIVSRHLHTSHAFHSAMVEPIVEPLRQRLQHIRLSPPTLPAISCVTGTWIQESEATSTQYWARHARETVRFADGIKTILGMESAPILLEVGAGNGLSTLAFQALQGATNPVVTSLQDSARESSDRACMLEALGRLWTQGVEPNWSALHAQPLRRVPLPTYPFERKRFWIDAPPKQRSAAATTSTAPVDAVAPAPAISQDLTVTTEQNAPASPQPDRIAELSAAIATVLEGLSGNPPPSTTAPWASFTIWFLMRILAKVPRIITS